VTSKVIKNTALGCDDNAAVLGGDGHINLVDGIAVYHIPVSSMEKWKPTTRKKEEMAKLTDKLFKQSCAHNSLKTLKWREGCPCLMECATRPF
jgi:hypothetical protein